MATRRSLLAAAPLLALAAPWLAGAGQPPVPVRVQSVVLAPALPPLVLPGTIAARTTGDLAFRVGGKIASRPVDIGDHVTAGQLLASLDPADLRVQEQAAAAALEAARAEAIQAEADWHRYAALGRNSPAYIAAEYDRRLAAMQASAARLAQAQRQLDLARNQQSYGELRADADGVVTALPAQVGQVVAAGQAVATLARTGALEVAVDVPENRLPDATPGKAVAVTIWARPDLALHGTVREIGALAHPASRTFTVKVTLDQTPPGLALGMTAFVAFNTGGPPVATLPAAAIADRDGAPAVYLIGPDGAATLRPVTLAGYTGDGRAIVAAGLNPGDKVITAGLHELRPGLTVTAWDGAQR